MSLIPCALVLALLTHLRSNRGFSRRRATNASRRRGSPGHAVIVVDVAQNRAGERVFLLAQSYMPAQDIHILNSADDVNPWSPRAIGRRSKTPEWTFSHGDLKRFRPSTCERPREP